MSSSNSTSIRSTASPPPPPPSRLGGLRHQAGVERRGVEAVEAKVHRPHPVVADVGEDAAERRGDAGIARHQRRLEADLLEKRADVQRPAAAEGHGGEAAGIVTALDRHQADRARHAAVGDAHDGLGGLEDAEAERAADLLGDGGLRRLHVQAPERPADRPLGVDAAEHDGWRPVSVGRSPPPP
jgi:hypothetical protein